MKRHLIDAAMITAPLAIVAFGIAIGYAVVKLAG